MPAATFSAMVSDLSGGPVPGRRRRFRRSRGRILCAALVSASLWLTPALAAATKIYRTVDENGNVVFTDQPPRPDATGDQVRLESGNSFTPAPAGQAAAVPGGELEEDEGAVPAVNYRSLTVASPADDAALRDNAGTVAVTASIEPALASGHQLQVYLDGALQQSSPVPTTQLLNVDRGTHTLELRIVDGTGATLITSPGSVFHLQRRSVLLQPARKAGN